MLLAIIYKPEMTSRRFIRKVASHLKYKWRFWKAECDPDLLLADNLNFCSISHSFRVISDDLQIGNDVTPISPLGGVEPQLYVGIMKGRPRLTIIG